MKFLVLLRPRGNALPAPDPLAVNKAAKTYIGELRKSAFLEAAYAFAAGGGMAILDAPSHERLWELIFEYPLYSAFDWEVEPLVDADYVFSRGIEMMQEAQGG